MHISNSDKNSVPKFLDLGFFWL